MFGQLKDWRGIAMRFCRCAHTFDSFVCLALIQIFFLCPLNLEHAKYFNISLSILSCVLNIAPWSICINFRFRHLPYFDNHNISLGLLICL